MFVRDLFCQDFWSGGWYFLHVGKSEPQEDVVAALQAYSSERNVPIPEEAALPNGIIGAIKLARVCNSKDVDHPLCFSSFGGSAYSIVAAKEFSQAIQASGKPGRWIVPPGPILDEATQAFECSPETQFSDILPPTVKWDQSRAKQRKENQESRHTFAFPPRAAAQHEKHQCLSAQSFPGMPMPQAIGKRLVQNQARYLLRRKQKSSKWYGYADSRLGFFIQDARALSSRFWMPPRRVLLWHIFNPWLGGEAQRSAQILCSVASTLWTQNAIYIYIYITPAVT